MRNTKLPEWSEQPRLHPAFDPDSYSLQEAEETLDGAMEQALSVEGRLDGLACVVLGLRREVQAQRLLLERLVAILGGED